MDRQYAMTGPGVPSSHRDSSGPTHQVNAPSTLQFIPGDAPPIINQQARQVAHGEPPHHHYQHQGPTTLEQRPQGAGLFRHQPPAMQSAPPPDSGSQQPMHTSPQMPYRLGPPPPPMNLQLEPAIQGGVPAGSIPPQHGRGDHHNHSSSQTSVSNAMPPQVSGLNFQYDPNAPYRSQNFAPRLPLSHPINHVHPAPHPAPQPTRNSMDYGAGGYTQSNILQPSSRQYPIDLTQSIPAQSTTGPSTPQSTSHPGHHRQSSLCSPFCQPNCTAAHDINTSSQQSHGPPNQGGPAPPPPPPNHFPRPPPQASQGSLVGYQRGGPHPSAPPAQQVPPAPQRQHLAPQQPPPAAERPPAPEQQFTPQNRPPSQQRYNPQQHPPSQVTQSYAQPNGPPAVPRGNTQPSPHTVQPSAQKVGPSNLPRKNSVGSAVAPPPSAVRGSAIGDDLQNAQKAVFNEAIVAALTPLQSGIEQLWSHAVDQFHTVLGKVTMAYTEALQAERDKSTGAEERLKHMQSDNVKLMHERCRLGEKMTSLEKEMENLKHAMKIQGDALVASQNKAALLAGEKGRLEVELSSLQNIGRKIADSGIAPPQQLISIFLQQEVAQEVERKLREAHQEVQEHLAARRKVEKQLHGMKEKLKALAGYDMGDLDKRTSISPGRETSTVVGTPPPKQSHHSRKHSSDMTVSSPLVSPVPQPSLPPSSAPTSPVVLRAAPPIERRPSPRPQLPTPPTTAAALKPSVPGQGAQEETARSFSVPSRPMNVRSETMPAVGNNAWPGVGLKRSRSAAGQDPGEPSPVRRMTVDSEGPRREGIQSRSGSRGPLVPAPPIVSISSDGTVNDGASMNVDPPQQNAATSPAPSLETLPAPPPPVVEEVDVKPSINKEDVEEEEKVEVKLEDQIDQLMDELVSYDDELEEGEVTDVVDESVKHAPKEIKKSSPAPASLERSGTAQASASSPSQTSPHYREHVAEQGGLSSPKPPASHQSSPAPPPSANPTTPGVPSSRSWATSSYVPPARSWAQAYPGRPFQPSSSAPASVNDERSSKIPAGPPKLSVLKHWDLLYSDEGTQWKCRLCQSMPDPGKSRAVFNKKTETHEAMLQHSQKEHPVACADMAKLPLDKLAEMKARLR